jgi:hypothetical protein
MAINAAQRAGFQRGANPFDRGMKKLRLLAETVGGASDPGVQAAAKVLVKAIKKQISKKAPGFQNVGKRGKGPHYGESSQPGQAPRRQAGQLWRSIGTQVVAGVLRVGSSDFTAPILNDGAILDEQVARAADIEKFIPKAGTRKGKVTSKRARKGRRRIKIEPRPFMEPGLADAQRNGMTDAVVGGVKRSGDKILG